MVILQKTRIRVDTTPSVWTVELLETKTNKLTKNSQ